MPKIGLKNYEIIHTTALEYALTGEKFKKIIFSKFHVVGECCVKISSLKKQFLAFISKTKNFLDPNFFYSESSSGDL